MQYLFYQFYPSVSPVPVLGQNEWTYRKLFESDRGIILVFVSPTAVTKFHGDPLSGGVKCTKVGKFCKYYPLSRKRYEIGPHLL